MDLLIIPYHDWRKVQREGGRTRDAHLISHCIRDAHVDRVLIINRPISISEMLARRRTWKTRGELIHRNRWSQLVKIGDHAFVLDVIDPDVLGPVMQGKTWFLSAFSKPRYVRTVTHSLAKLEIASPHCVSFNLFAAELVEAISAERKLFDAWDNFLRFPEYQDQRNAIATAYQRYAQSATLWTTNSESNKITFEAQYGVTGCTVVRNGVDLEVFSQAYDLPNDLRGIPRPIIGLGAKVTHLLDHDLMNQLLHDHPDLSFVLVGQILDSSVFRKIHRTSNFFYLGDKHYDQYPAYVHSFDVCLIPYVVGDKQHGGDAIKFYEYLAAGKPIVTTRFDGVSASYPNIYIADNHQEFSLMVRAALNAPHHGGQVSDQLTWHSRSQELLRLLRNGQLNTQ